MPYKLVCFLGPGCAADRKALLKLYEVEEVLFIGNGKDYLRLDQLTIDPTEYHNIDLRTQFIYSSVATKDFTNKCTKRVCKYPFLDKSDTKTEIDAHTVYEQILLELSKLHEKRVHVDPTVHVFSCHANFMERDKVLELFTNRAPSGTKFFVYDNIPNGLIYSQTIHTIFKIITDSKSLGTNFMLSVPALVKVRMTMIQKIGDRSDPDFASFSPPLLNDAPNSRLLTTYIDCLRALEIELRTIAIKHDTCFIGLNRVKKAPFIDSTVRHIVHNLKILSMDQKVWMPHLLSDKLKRQITAGMELVDSWFDHELLIESIKALGIKPLIIDMESFRDQLYQNVPSIFQRDFLDFLNTPEFVSNSSTTFDKTPYIPFCKLNTIADEIFSISSLTRLINSFYIIYKEEECCLTPDAVDLIIMLYIRKAFQFTNDEKSHADVVWFFENTLMRSMHTRANFDLIYRDAVIGNMEDLAAKFSGCFNFSKYDCKTSKYEMDRYNRIQDPDEKNRMDGWVRDYNQSKFERELLKAFQEAGQLSLLLQHDEPACDETHNIDVNSASLKSWEDDPEFIELLELLELFENRCYVLHNEHEPEYTNDPSITGAAEQRYCEWW